jgi:DMSO/TMAO reductase YedYZ molybdopterin-dependent catalytic subunit
MIRALRSRSFIAEMRTNLARTRPEPPDAGYLAPVAPAAPTISRRGVLAFAVAGAALAGALTVGQSLGGRFRKTALLAPHDQPVTGADAGTVGDFQINNTARNAQVNVAETGEAWELTIATDNQAIHVLAKLSRGDLLRMEQHTASLPIACVEGWSTDNQTWTGVRLRDLAALSGIASPSTVLVQSLGHGSGFNKAVLSGTQIMDPDSLLALQVNGADLSLDHGYPARVIVPNNPGVHNTKWVSAMIFGS